MARRWFVPVAGLVLGLVLGFSLLFAQATTTFTVTNNGITSYVIDGTNNPNLKLLRGQTYVFQVNAVGHPFWIKSIQSTGTGNAFNNGVTSNGTQSGSVTFVVPMDAPSTLFYDCEFHPSMTGQLDIANPTPALQQTWGRTKAIYR